jgi:hypothetical protein
MNKHDWYIKNDTGDSYEYLGQSYAQFAGSFPVACMRDVNGHEIEHALCYFPDDFTLSTKPTDFMAESEAMKQRAAKRDRAFTESISTFLKKGNP